MHIEDRWDFYPAKVDHMPASIFVNFSYRERAPILGIEENVGLILYFLHPRDDGLSSEMEYETLFAVEKALETHLQESGVECHYVGRNTSDGARDFHFYCRERESVERTLTEAMSEFPQYKFEIAGQRDADWSVYLEFLYPSPRSMQLVRDQRLLEHLAESNDQLETPREVKHWAYFPDAKSQQEFASRTQELGFVLVNQYERGGDSNTFGCIIARTHAVSYSAITNITLELFDIANELGGSYDGWETPIVSDI